jgi:RNA polymerase sigma factor (sigma-70 family)
MDDWALLRAYVDDGSEAAFTELVRRHLNLVYSVAARMLGDSQAAGDVVQTVFCRLAQKAARLRPAGALTGWLYQTACLCAREHRRNEHRRQARLEKVMAMQDHSPPSQTDAAWEQLAPLLEDALLRLPESDRLAVLLRFFEQKPLREVGLALGVEEEAARKRISRALERLRRWFARRGVTCSTEALAGFVSINAVQAAPVGLAGTVAPLALSAAGHAATTGLLSHTLNLFTTMSPLKTSVVTAVAVAAVLSVPLALLWNQNRQLERDLAAARSAIADAQTVREENARLRKGTVDSGELARLRKGQLELLRLRGRVTQLANELRQRRAAETHGGTNQFPASPPASPADETDSLLFSAALTNRVSSGHTLVVGGWSKQGMRGYLLATPAVRGEDALDGRRVTVESQFVGAPESFWEALGWGTFKSDVHRSALAGVITPEQHDALLQALKETEDSIVSNTSRAEHRDGERGGVGYTMSDDRETGVVMGIDYRQQITPDGQAVELELFPSSVPTNRPIHSTLTAPSSAAPTPPR